MCNSPGGREIARRLTVRHHLIERMLHEIFGMEWTKVHEEAERLEHAVSADFEARLAKVGRRRHSSSWQPDDSGECGRPKSVVDWPNWRWRRPDEIRGGQCVRARSAPAGISRLAGSSAGGPHSRRGTPLRPDAQSSPPSWARSRWAASRRKKSGWLRSDGTKRHINHVEVSNVSLKKAEYELAKRY